MLGTVSKNCPASNLRSQAKTLLNPVQWTNSIIEIQNIMHTGFGQDRVNFLSSQEEAWLRPRYYPVPLYVNYGGQRKRLSLDSEEKRFLLEKMCWGGPGIVVDFPCKFFLCLISLLLTLLLLLSYLIAVFSKLFLSQAMIFAFRASSWRWRE